MIIYCITNIINNKKYVGKTIRSLKTRQKSHEKLSSTTCLIDRAINKYGKHNFQWEILESNLNKDVLNEREKYWIDQLNTRNLEIGYNISEGGDGCLGYNHSQEAKNKISHKSKTMWIEASIEKRAKMCSGSPFKKGYNPSDMTRQKISKSNKGKIPWNKMPSKIIYCPFCGISMIKRENSNSKFCSRLCANTYNAKSKT